MPTRELARQSAHERRQPQAQREDQRGTGQRDQRGHHRGAGRQNQGEEVRHERDERADYARRRGMTADAIRKIIPDNTL